MLPANVESAAIELQSSGSSVVIRSKRAAKLVSTLAGFSPCAQTSDAQLRLLGECLSQCLALEITEDVNLARVAAEVLRILHLGDQVQFTAEVGAKLLRDPLCQKLLTRTRNVDATLEIALRDYRRLLLMKYGPAWVSKKPALGSAFKSIFARFRSQDLPKDAPVVPNQNDLRDAATIATQNLENDYVQNCGPEEKNILDQLQPLITAGPRQGEYAGRIFQSMCVLYGMYRPLHVFKNVCDLAGSKDLQWEEPAAAFVERALLLPMKTRAYAESIEKAGKLEDLTSIAVKNQYEANPYPRWRVRPSPNPTTVRNFLAEMSPECPAPDARSDDPYRVLVAGCGTGRQAISSALQFPEAEIIATDVSTTSLGYARLMCEFHGITNVQFIQNDLLHCDALGKTFHLIECVGVLHHLEEPETGLKALWNIMQPGGLLRIGLYSETGRAPIIAARERIEALAFEATPDDMRAYREKVIFGHEPKTVWDIMRYPDFYNLSEFRDMLFNVKEHRFSLPEIQQLIESVGLTFKGFELPREALAAYRSRFPDDKGMTNLDNWDAFENEQPNLFSKMYVFWCQRHS